MFRASQREIVGPWPRCAWPHGILLQLARGDQRKLSAAGHAASHGHWLRTIATADWS